MIRLAYGTQQKFRFHHSDINILGEIDLPAAPEMIERSEYQLNDSAPVHFYIEPKVDANTPGKYPYDCKTPSCHRLRNRPGHFNIEISIENPVLVEGWNTVKIEVESSIGSIERADLTFHWDPQPVLLPLDLSDLSGYQSVQEIGQVVNGAFDIDPECNVVRARSPVGSDILFLVGSPYESQEATYDVRFADRKVFIGVSDFFTAHAEQSPDLGIKPGYCTSGLATIDGRGNAQIWIAWGDNLMDNDLEWVVRTENDFAHIDIEIGVLYSVRHQTIIGNGINCSRFRVWRKGTSEPAHWLCEEHNGGLAPKFPRNKQASFGLFQYFGAPTEWSNIRVRALDIDFQTFKLKRKPNRYVRKLRKKFVDYARRVKQINR
ncbi:MAG: hypothetical protein AAFU78_21075 [Cyanobacteria bacterium J06633_2]